MRFDLFDGSGAKVGTATSSAISVGAGEGAWNIVLQGHSPLATPIDHAPLATTVYLGMDVLCSDLCLCVCVCVQVLLVKRQWRFPCRPLSTVMTNLHCVCDYRVIKKILKRCVAVGRAAVDMHAMHSTHCKCIDCSVKRTDSVELAVSQLANTTLQQFW